MSENGFAKIKHNAHILQSKINNNASYTLHGGLNFCKKICQKMVFHE